MDHIGLAETKKKKRFTLNPRGTLWTNDQKKVGQRLLEKMGWEKGKGLGKEGQGISEPISAIGNNENRGMGYKSNAEDWVVHYDAFENVLADLNKASNLQSSNENSDPNSERENAAESLEQLSKNSKNRVHYKKFTRGKDLSRYSEDDLACVLGSKRSSKKPGTPVTEVKKEKTDIGEVDKSFGLTSVHGGSLKDYFSQKMEELKKKREGGLIGGSDSPHSSTNAASNPTVTPLPDLEFEPARTEFSFSVEVEDTESTSQEEVVCHFDPLDRSNKSKKKRKKKDKDSLGESENERKRKEDVECEDENGGNVEMNMENRSKKKKKDKSNLGESGNEKKRKDNVECEDENGGNVETNKGSDIGSKKKKKKKDRNNTGESENERKRKEDLQCEDEHDGNVETKIEDDIGSKKKKKKNKKSYVDNVDKENCKEEEETTENKNRNGVEREIINDDGSKSKKKRKRNVEITEIACEDVNDTKQKKKKSKKISENDLRNSKYTEDYEIEDENSLKENEENANREVRRNEMNVSYIAATCVTEKKNKKKKREIDDSSTEKPLKKLKKLASELSLVDLFKGGSDGPSSNDTGTSNQQECIGSENGTKEGEIEEFVKPMKKLKSKHSFKEIEEVVMPKKKLKSKNSFKELKTQIEGKFKKKSRRGLDSIEEGEENLSQKTENVSNLSRETENVSNRSQETANMSNLSREVAVSHDDMSDVVTLSVPQRHLKKETPKSKYPMKDITCNIQELYPGSNIASVKGYCN